MKIKILLLLPLVLILVSCIMPVVPSWNPDLYNNYTTIQGFQKPYTLGHTNVEQRKQDLKECGVRKFFGGTLDLNTQYPDMTDDQVTPRRIRIYNCMKSKGYIIIGREKCTKNGKSTGKCN